MCKSVPKCIKGLFVTEVRAASRWRRGECPKGVGAWLGLKCMGDGWGGGMHRTADTPLGLWSCLEIDPSVYQLVSDMHVLVKFDCMYSKMKRLSQTTIFSPSWASIHQHRLIFQQFSKLYLPTAYVWFYISFGVLHGKFIQAQIFPLPFFFFSLNT